MFKRRSNSKDTSIIDFIVGIVLFIIGLGAILKNTSVATSIFGNSTLTGVVLIPMIIGIVILFLNYKSRIGWGLLALGVIALLIGLIFSVRIIFHTTSLGQYLMMFGSTFIGIILILKGLLR